MMLSSITPNDPRMSGGRGGKFTWTCGHPFDPLVVRLFSPSNKRMVAAGRCCRREASGNNVGFSGSDRFLVAIR
jgi:hypothetical protein